MSTLYSSKYDETIQFTDISVRMHLTANNIQTFTVPGNPVQKFQALFSYISTSNVYVGYNTVPTIPAGNTQQSTNFIEFRPEKRYVQTGDVIQLVSPDADAHVGITFRLLPDL